MRFDVALAAESRPHGSGVRVTSVPVWRDDCYTIAASGDWELSVALVKAVLS